MKNKSWARITITFLLGLIILGALVLDPQVRAQQSVRRDRGSEPVATPGSTSGPATAVSNLAVNAGRAVSLQSATGTAFTYQGYLNDSGSPAISVRPGPATGSWQILSPRQEITPAPYADFALSAPWSGLIQVPADIADGDHSLPQRALAPQANVGTAHDVNSDGGDHSSITIGIDGLPIISYYDFMANALKVAHCADIACTQVISMTVDASPGVGSDTSIAIGRDGLPIISYFDSVNSAIKFARCLDTQCTQVISKTLASTVMSTGQGTSITVDKNGNPVISYYNASLNQLHLEFCNDPECNTWSPLAIWGGGEYSSIGINPSGYTIVSYKDGIVLRMLICRNTPCSNWSATAVDYSTTNDVGQYSSITIGSDGLAIISYYDATYSALKVAHCENHNGCGATITTLDSIGDVGRDTSITIGSDGLPIISYYDTTNKALKVAHCDNVACTGAAIATVASGNVSGYTAITIGVDGLPVISYWENPPDNLAVVHCANPFCTSFLRRR